MNIYYNHYDVGHMSKIAVTPIYDGGDRDGHRILGPSLVNCRQNATIWPLCPTYERAKDDRPLIFHFHENGTNRV